MRDVILRLRKARSESLTRDKHMYDDGTAHGTEWAMKSAHPDQLTRLQKLKEDTDDGLWAIMNLPDDEGDPTAYLASIIHTGRPGSVRAPQFWNSALRMEKQTAAPTLAQTDPLSQNRHFLRGFADGALKVWAEVEAAVNAPNDPED